MAQSFTNVLLKQVQGHIGKQIVVKQYGKKIVITKYPKMDHIRPTKGQKAQRRTFAMANKYARGINNDPILHAKYAKNLKAGETVYRNAMKEYFRNHSTSKTKR